MFIAFPSLNSCLIFGVHYKARLAKAIGVDQSYISLIERNERPLTDELRQKISAVLGCKPEELLRELQRPGLNA